MNFNSFIAHPAVRRTWLIQMLTLALAITSCLQAKTDPAFTNIVFLFTDDMGFGDIATYGAPDVRTPNLDQLAAEGVRFSQFYGGGAECTPSRTAFLTGRYPERVGGLECAIGVGNVGRYDHAANLAARNDLGLPASSAVLAPALQRAGYATAIVGKWHMGYDPKFNPLDQGFDYFWGFLGGFVDYFQHRELSDLDVLMRGREPTEAEGYMTHLITDEALGFIERHQNEPFFLYAAYSAPHFPFQKPVDGDQPPPTTWPEMYLGGRDNYVVMIEDLDAEIGRILALLEEKGLAEKTLVVFASDHGAMGPGRNSPFSRGKSTLFEGGLRVPAIMRWPGKLPAGTVSTQPTWIMDLTPSFLRIGDASPSDGQPLDGIDIVRRVQLDLPIEPRTFYWRFRRGDASWRSVLKGEMKYLLLEETAGRQEWLFDLNTDPAELFNLSPQLPETTHRLRKILAQWEEEVHTPRGRD